MTKKLLLRLAIATLCLTLPIDATRAEAQVPITGKAAAGFLAIFVVIGVAVGFGVYYVVRAPRHIEGCIGDNGDGLEIYNEGSRETYILSGDVAALQTGQKVRLSGKPGKTDQRKNRSFLVQKVNKEYGACKP